MLGALGCWAVLEDSNDFSPLQPRRHQVNWFAAGIDAEEYAHITRADEIVCSGGETSRSCVLVCSFAAGALLTGVAAELPSGYCLTNCQLDRSDRSFPPSGPPKGAPKSISGSCPQNRLG